MGEFRVQVGDVAKLRFHRGKKTVTEIVNGYVGLSSDKGKPYPWWIIEAYFLRLAKTIHRPTPSGMKQVWPEVESA